LDAFWQSVGRYLWYHPTIRQFSMFLCLVLMWYYFFVFGTYCHLDSDTKFMTSPVIWSRILLMNTVKNSVNEKIGLEWAGGMIKQAKNSDDNKMWNDFKIFVFKQLLHFYEDTNSK